MGTQPSGVRERILGSASSLFYTEGVRAVSADKIIAAAGTTKVTFYRYFRSKDDLVVAYLQEQSAGMQERAAALDPDPCTGLRQLAEVMGTEACSPGFRGCPFINAAAEYPDPEHPVRMVITGHRAWLHSLVAGRLRLLGVQEADSLADQLLMLRDGAMVYGYVEDGTAVGPALAAAGEALVLPRITAGKPKSAAQA
ncbi:TetR/AcrR family transcriptional regulator [Arthrobacter sp. zg-Y20]|uniref:TetR/AcrR family transcriptional regulator n=1 Tax=unclassified Arthrobacter TaxID=235627 RepID=UPI001D158600|nr:MULTISPECIES: TetR/AcrR family transcriptional regulator [unclassified Arthrobacter]MCC3275858.1 TetR/AcrR family transcriptional regulator [Arthrobacter sp. zg-Y20]MDK1316015.1 TetR/AcrR family transcriptional regulator [Arthrobacter sp. zg.Y20]WIB05689.1 TetR/AcrR family transcriptional regulator [Arthrobacter sp. zg-Y20]